MTRDPKADPSAFIVGGHPFTWTPASEDVKRSGGGRPVNERLSIRGDRIVTVGHQPGRRIKISGGDGMVMLTSDAEYLRARQATRKPFSVYFGRQYETSGDFMCLIDGDLLLAPVPEAPELSTYDFTLYII